VKTILTMTNNSTVNTI